MYTLKDSNVKWIGSIPEEWKIEKVKYYFYQKKEKAHQDNPIVLSLARSGVRVRDISNNEGQLAASYFDYNPVEPGDLLLNPMDLYSGANCNVSKITGVISPAYANLKSKGYANPEYYNYYFKVQYLIMALFAHGKGVSADNRWTLNNSALLNYLIPVPTRDEQDKIVQYLDWQTSIINRLIDEKKREIGLIEEIKSGQIATVAWGQNSSRAMKSSGFLGVDKVPNHWSVLSNKRVFKERNEKSESGTETLLSVSRHYGVKPCNELSEDEQYATIKPAESLVGYKIVKKNDLAMNIMRAQNGSYGISDYEGIVSPAYCVYELLPGYSPKYMHYLLKTPQMISIFFAASSGITDHRRRLYADDFLRIKIAVPPLEEQEQIVEQIEKIEAIFQGKTSAIEKQIELLKELRTRLISDVVIGQIDVRGVDIPEYEFVEDVSEDSEDSESEEEIEEQEGEE